MNLLSRSFLVGISAAVVAGCSSSSSQLKSQPTGHPLGAAYEISRADQPVSDFYAFYDGTGVARFVDGKNWVGLFDYNKRTALLGDQRTLTYVKAEIDPVKFPVIIDESEAATKHAQSIGTGVVRNFPCHKWKVLADGLSCEIWTDDFDRFPVFYTTNSGNDTVTWTVKNCWVEPAVLSVPGFFTLENFFELEPADDVQPAALKRLKSLAPDNSAERVYLKGATATDAALDEVSKVPSVQALDIDRSAKITNRGLAALSKMSNLKVLRIDEPAVTDVGLTKVAMMPSLISLQLTSPVVRDSALVGLRHLDHLQHLSLAETAVTGRGLKELVRFPALHTLDLAKTRVTDASLANLAKCTALKELRLDGTHVSLAGLKHLRAIKSLKSVSVIGTEPPITEEELAGFKSHFFVRLRYTDSPPRKAEHSDLEEKGESD